MKKLFLMICQKASSLPRPPVFTRTLKMPWTGLGPFDTNYNQETTVEDEPNGEAGDANIKKHAKVPLNVHDGKPHWTRSHSVISVEKTKIASSSDCEKVDQDFLQPFQPQKLHFQAEDDQLYQENKQSCLNCGNKVFHFQLFGRGVTK